MSDDTEATMMKGPGMVPCVDLVRPHEELEDELLHGFRTALWLMSRVHHASLLIPRIRLV
jgi:hypothetical protein